MHKLALASSTALGIVLGAVLFNAVPALAQMAVIDVSSIAQEIGMGSTLSTISSIISSVNSGITAVNSALSSTGPIASMLGVGQFGSVQDLLQQGFTQEANYSKASVGAQQQIADASNTVNARFSRDLRNAQIRDEQTINPNACTALDNGVSAQAAAVQAFAVGASIARIHDLRGQAAVGMPSHFGQAEGSASMDAQHIANYCNADDAAAHLCTLSATPDADQQMYTLFGSGTYRSQAAVNAAKDYATNLIQPVAPAAIRGDQLASTAGQEAVVERRGYNARMSLAQSFVDNAIGMQVPSVPLTPLQNQYLQNLGLPAQTTGSWLQALQIESERRTSDITWNANLQSMPPASVEREIAMELAQTNYLLFQIFKVNLEHATISATALAGETQKNFMPTVRMPTPNY